MSMFNPFKTTGGGGGGGSATLIEKSITENGEYNASVDNADGYSKVTVNVAGGGGETFEVNIVADMEHIETDKTYAETIAAYNNGATLRINMTISDDFTPPFTVTNVGCGVRDDAIMLFFDGEEWTGISSIVYFMWSNSEIYEPEWFIGDIQRRKL